jgi:ubiquitin C-terminal hydrolase
MKLDLTEHLIDKKKTKLIYELCALVIHEGRFSYKGHYFAYVKGFDSKWYK